MPKLSIALLTTLFLLAFSFNANAIEVPSFSICGSKWYQRLGLQLLEIEQAIRGGYSFDVACQAHDACYGDCRTPRSDCDKKLLADAEGVCDSARNRQNCAADAQIFFQAVSEKGDMPFRQARAHCSGTSQQIYPDAVTGALGGGGATSAAGKDQLQGKSFNNALPASLRMARRPGNDFGEAGALVAGKVATATLNREDKHYYRFVPGHTETYIFFSRGGNRTYGELYNERFDRLARNDDAGEEGNFRIAARLSAGQTYYVMVRGQPGPYALHVEGPEGSTASDDHGFSSWSATAVAVGSITAGAIDVPKDQDYFKFKAGQTATYVIFTRGGNRTYGELYNERFDRLARDDDAGEEGNFHIAARLSAGQTYYVMVRGQPGPYALHVEGPEGSTASDDHGFSSWSATAVAVGSITAGAIDVPKDQDYFKFKAGQTATYVIFTRGGNRTYGELYNERFDRLARNDDAGEEGNFRIAARLSAGQTYYVMVRGQPGPYALHVEGPEGSTASDDHGFSSWSATAVAVGSITAGAIDVPKDQDYFKFKAGQTATYVLFTRGGNRTYGELNNERFDRIARDSNSGEEGNFRFTARLTEGQTYYLMVRGEPGPYTLHIDGPESHYSATEVKVGRATVSQCHSSEITALALAALKDKAAGTTFGYLCEPYIQTGLGLHAHAGIDLIAGEGTPVYAIASGDVVVVDRLNLGKLMIKLPDGKSLIYLHLTRIDVREGQSVSFGDLLGLSGSKGANSPHLHIEVRKNYSGKFALGGESCEGGECNATQVAEKTVDPAAVVGR